MSTEQYYKVTNQVAAEQQIVIYILKKILVFCVKGAIYRCTYIAI